ncbi:hypothetical protein KX729_30340 [Rhizobium sp. XQZ8]|uniref:hypothetical protein n=1 Tax=Rhizobium populisoli TaxID=2859785 RepID=UPI001CA4D14C|nr:hypothetical protein [Rhizobium populisoli]MBW6425693.1 hypothetical protein [Rhizobium populisoli]
MIASESNVRCAGIGGRLAEQATRTYAAIAWLVIGSIDPRWSRKGANMNPEQRVKLYQETVERLRADLEWLHTSGFYVQSATNEELAVALEQAATSYLAIIEEFSRPPG